MVCIYCGSKTEVTNSRPQKRTNSVWRRRHCTQCDAIFSTTESNIYENNLVVRCNASKIAPFQRDILFISVYEACKHRTNAVEDAAALTMTILAMLLPQVTNGSLERQDIVESTYSVLQQFDNAAYVQYRAFYPLDK